MPRLAFADNAERIDHEVAVPSFTGNGSFGLGCTGTGNAAAAEKVGGGDYDEIESTNVEKLEQLVDTWLLEYAELYAAH